MFNKKLISTLKALDRAEFAAFCKFVNSPIHNKHQQVIQLFEFIKKHKNKQPKKLYDHEMIAKQLFGYVDYPKLRILSHQLLSLLDEFIMWKEWNANDSNKHLLLMKFCGERQLEFRYNDAKKKAKSWSRHAYYSNSNFYLNEHKYQLEAFQLAEPQKQHRIISFNADALSENLDIYFFIERLQIACHVLQMQAIVGKAKQESSSDRTFLPKIIEHLKANPQLLEQHRTLELFFHCYTLLTDSVSREKVVVIREQLFASNHLVSETDLVEIYAYVFNYLVKKLKEEEMFYLQEIFALLSFQFEHWIFMEPELPATTFNNAVTVGLRLSELNWVASFIQDFGPKIKEEQREETVAFNRARLFFEQKDYHDVIRQLNRDFENITYQLQSRILLIKVYYETDEMEMLYDFLSSFRVYVSRFSGQISKPGRRSCLAFVRFTKQLTKIAPGEVSKIAKLRTQIESTKGVGSKKWLFEKLAELE